MTLTISKLMEYILYDCCKTKDLDLYHRYNHDPRLNIFRRLEAMNLSEVEVNCDNLAWLIGKSSAAGCGYQAALEDMQSHIEFMKRKVK